MNRTTRTPRGTRASVAARARRVVLSLIALLLVLSAGAQALAQELDTLEPGKLTAIVAKDMVTADPEE